MLTASHIIVEYDRTNQVMVSALPVDFPSDADASQYARDRCNAGVNVTAYTTERWLGRRATGSTKCA